MTNSSKKQLELEREKFNLKIKREAEALSLLNDQLEANNKVIETQATELEFKKINEEKTTKRLEESKLKLKLQRIELAKLQDNMDKLVIERTAKLEKAKAKAEESEHLKMAFLANMSHEIRTPMNAIIGFSNLLSDEDISEAEKTDFISQIVNNSETLMVLINDILDLSKIEANQLVITKENFDVNSFMSDIYLNWKITEQKHTSKIKLVFDNQDLNETIPCNSDIFRLRQVINNLIENAFKFTEKGTISIGFRVEQNNIEFYVKDTGIGIPADNLQFIFNRFNKLNDSKKNIYHGAGLGLTISKKITELLGGTLMVNSSVSEGSEFILRIPLTEKSETNKGINEVKKFRTSHSRPRNQYIDLNLLGKKIMVVEDEVNNYKYLEGVLRKHNATIVWAKNGEEAVTMMASQKLDLILMDIKMPKMNGIEATRRIKSVFPDQKIIAQTAYARSDEEAEYKSTGFDDFIAKPIKRDDLLGLIKKHLQA